MKVWRWFAKAALLSVFAWYISGCETAQSVDRGPRFREADTADVVLRFAAWDYIYFSQPDYREGGFIRSFKRDELGKAFDNLGLHRDTAVVVVGWTYQAEVLDQVVADWKSVLRSCGFRRVVCLRGSGSSNINGLAVLDDTNSSTVRANQAAGL